MRGPTWWRLTLMRGSFPWDRPGARNDSTLAADDEQQARGEQDREDDPSEARLVHAREERHADEEPERGRHEEYARVAPDLGREQARPPVADHDHHLVHEKERLEIRLDGARRPTLRRRVQHDVAGL